MADEAPPLSPQTPPLAGDAGSFLESLMDTELYSIGAFFCDEHPDLVDEVVARSEAIERSGLEAYRGRAAGRSRRASRRCSPASRFATTRRSPG